MRPSTIATIFAGYLAALPAVGHHSEAGYDTESVAAFEGTVTHYGWRNPHVYITVEATNESGEIVEWLVETGATPIMARSGWTPQSLSPGEVISVRGHPDKRAGKYGVIGVHPVQEGLHGLLIQAKHPEQLSNLPAACGRRRSLLYHVLLQ